jgi:hypothetical protein
LICCRRLAWSFALLGWLLFAAQVARQGGCGREPEPVPADCKPDDDTCHAGEPATPPSPPAGGAG